MDVVLYPGQSNYNQLLYENACRVHRMKVHSERLILREYQFTESQMEKYQDRLLGIERRHDALKKRKEQGRFRIWKHYLDLDMRAS